MGSGWRGCEVSFWGNENDLNLDYGYGCTTANILKPTELYTLTGTFTWDCVNCEFYLNKAIFKKLSQYSMVALVFFFI